MDVEEIRRCVEVVAIQPERIRAAAVAADSRQGIDVAEKLAGILKGLSTGPSSTRIARLMVMTEPPSIDANEITDKGYINQRAVLERRAAQVEGLYSGATGVILAAAG